jgi:hypothetical protein
MQQIKSFRELAVARKIEMTNVLKEYTEAGEAAVKF